MSEKLEAYNEKRNFYKTGEPPGKAAQPQGPLKFVIQHHMARRDHYDLRLEWDGALLSWAVPKGPSYNTRDKRLAVEVEDHPLEYRNFEGTIPKGEYGGGVVMLWDEGTWEPQTDTSEGLREGSLKFILKGTRLKGKWALVRMKEKAGETKNNWLLLKEKDDYAKAEDGITGFTTSVRTGRTMEEIEKGGEEKIKRNPFHKTDVQLARLVSAVPEGEDWLYELKYDGYRILAYVEGSGASLITRNGNDYTHRFHDIALSLTDWASGRPMVLDGEMVITDSEGKTDFQALQNYLKNPRNQSLTYIIFDLLALDGEDLRDKPLLVRKQTLEALMKDCPKNLHYSQHIKGKGKESLLVACQSNLEGIVGKKADSIYSGTRNEDWIKLKCDTRQEFVIGGYTLTDKKTWGLSSLLLGVYEEGGLIYAGRAGTGFTEESMAELVNKFESLTRKASPFKLAPKPRSNEKITWLKPDLVAEIKFAQWTDDNQLRQASFKGLRTDKDPRDVRRETPRDDLPADDKPGESPSPSIPPEQASKSNGGKVTLHGIKISNPGKVIYDEPPVTKLDIVHYYARVWERMMPYAANRVLTMVRCPKGVNQPSFYKKHPGREKSEGLVTLPITTGSGKTEEYCYIESLPGLIYEVQMGTLEFHLWGSRADNLERPDMMVFDLDPDEGMDLQTVRRGVKDVKDILEQLSLKSFLKTSGGKGYHVMVPLKPSVEWDVFHGFARRVAEVMEQKWPDRYTSNVRKANRKNKIFIDWIRNGRGATSVAPYSLRARKGARVSMPISWNELDSVAPDAISIKEALLRIDGPDPWKDFHLNDQRLK